MLQATAGFPVPKVFWWLPLHKFSGIDVDSLLLIKITLQDSIFRFLRFVNPFQDLRENGSMSALFLYSKCNWLCHAIYMLQLCIRFCSFTHRWIIKNITTKSAWSYTIENCSRTHFHLWFKCLPYVFKVHVNRIWEHTLIHIVNRTLSCQTYSYLHQNTTWNNLRCVTQHKPFLPYSALLPGEKAYIFVYCCGRSVLDSRISL